MGLKPKQGQTILKLFINAETQRHGGEPLEFMEDSLILPLSLCAFALNFFYKTENQCLKNTTG